MSDKLWWNGPEYLRDPAWSPVYESFASNEETRKLKVTSNVASLEEKHAVCELIKRISSWTRMRRIIATCLRWKSRAKGELSAAEIEKAEDIIAIAAQRDFAEELEVIKKGKQLTRGPLVGYTPIIKDGLLRVRGRLQNVQHMTKDEQHNILLPKYNLPAEPKDYDQEGNLAKTLILHAHRQTMHGTVQQTLAVVQQKFRIVHAKAAVKKIIGRCVICRRYRKSTETQLMGNLPALRVNQAHAFEHTFVDCFGPIKAKSSFLRSRIPIKLWGIVFVCAATKAAHLEILSSMTAESYIMALKRFFARRGLCKTLIHDNGGNFVRGSRLIKAQSESFIAELEDKKLQKEIIDFCANQKINFLFNAPYSPHIVGLHESAVKSAKRHLQRVAGTALFNYEELLTLFNQAEMMLNSRPLMQIMPDEKESLILSPGSFLIGRQMNSLPEPDLTKTNVLLRWRLVEQQAQRFWHLWRFEYLHSLQQRKKWSKVNENVRLGQIVLMKSENLPKCCWELARIIKLRSDDEGVVRLVDLQRGSKIDTRHIAKLCLLPVYAEGSLESITEQAGDEQPEKEKIEEPILENQLTGAAGSEVDVAPTSDLEAMKIDLMKKDMLGNIRASASDDVTRVAAVMEPVTRENIVQRTPADKPTNKRKIKLSAAVNPPVRRSKRLINRGLGVAMMALFCVSASIATTEAQSDSFDTGAREQRSAKLEASKWADLKRSDFIKTADEGSLFLAHDTMINRYHGRLETRVITTINPQVDIETVETVNRHMRIACEKCKELKIGHAFCVSLLERVQIEAEQVVGYIRVHHYPDEVTRVKRRSKGILKTLLDFLFGGEDLSDVESHEVELDHEIENIKRWELAEAKADYNMKTSYFKMIEQITSMSKAFHSIDIDKVNFYSDMLFGQAIHTLEILKQKWNELEHPIYSTKEIQEMEARIHNALPVGTSVPPVSLSQLLKVSQCKVKSMNKDGLIVFTHSLPLIYPEGFHLLELTATPNLLNKQF